jgi:hypothetical protein
MKYRGPLPADYQNVEALNAAFIRLLLRPGQRSDTLLAGLPESQRSRLRGLTVLQRERLARTPFLLFSLRESDSRYWEQLFRYEPSAGLFDAPQEQPVAEAELLGAALGFLWQLARDNAYAARLVCGASLHWCEQLAEQPLLKAVRSAARADVMRLRRESDALWWHKLLYVGVASERPVRRAARISALQRMLTEGVELPRAPAALAASRIRRPSLKVAESNEP